MPEILLATNKGIIFEKTTTKNRCRVSVKNTSDGYAHMTYRFNNGVEPISSQYISWENLNCCGGWTFDENYLLTAVQDGKKLCAGITFDSAGELEKYKNSLSAEYKFFCAPPMHNGSYTTYYIDVVRDGAICNFINTNEVLKTYVKLGITDFNKELLTKFFAVPLHYFINGETLNYRQPRIMEEYIITGLILGYPLESTAWLIEKHGIPSISI